MNDVDLSENESVISQATYQPTPYSDSSWEIVGEKVETTEFVPMGIELLPRTYAFVDPMFADYGGDPGSTQESRWHLPEELAAQFNEMQRTGGLPATEEQEKQITLTEDELEAIKQQAFMEGQQAGLEAAVSANAERMELAETRMVQMMEDLQKQVGQHSRMIERQGVDLAMKIALKIVHETVSINPEYIVPVVTEALGLAGTASIRRVRVSAQDLEFIKLVGLEKNVKEFDGTWQFIVDDTVKNGCIVETSAGQIDFQLDPAWERIKDKVVKVI